MNGRVVILANGEFPQRGGEPFRLLSSAERVIACDGAAETYRRVFRREPTVLIGDLDSLSAKRPPACRVVKRVNPSCNDLSKAIAFCRAEHWSNPLIIGATGKREDHTIGNVYLALAAELPIFSDFGTFLPVKGRLTFRTWKNAGISVFAVDTRTRMTSRGLKWKLEGVRFSTPYAATLNRASSETVTLASDRPAMVFVERNPRAHRVLVSLGSNIGARANYLQRAVRALANLPQTRLLDVSEAIETNPVDVPAAYAEFKFLNQAAVFESELSPEEFSRRMHAIEDRLGRVRTARNGPRTIDIDLIDFSGIKRNDPELTLPHPRAKSRAFVTDPLASLGVALS